MISLGSLGSVVSHACEGGEESWVVFLFLSCVEIWMRGGVGHVTPGRHTCIFCSPKRSEKRS